MRQNNHIYHNQVIAIYQNRWFISLISHMLDNITRRSLTIGVVDPQIELHILGWNFWLLRTASFTPGLIPLASMPSTHHHPSALAAGMCFKPLKPTDRAWQPICSNLQSTVMQQSYKIHRQHHISQIIQIYSPVGAHTPFVQVEPFTLLRCHHILAQ